MKKLSVFLILAILATSLISASVLGAEVKSVGELKVGDKIVIDKNIEVTYLGKTAEGLYEYQAMLGAPKYLDDLVTSINCRWHFDAGLSAWVAEANLYGATVLRDAVVVQYKGSTMSWTPSVYIGGKEVTPASTMPDLLIHDPINENYIGNTLQWRYDGFTRNLRIIEGMLIEYYIIDSLPSGDIEIRNNVVKSVGYTYTRPVYVYDADYKPVECVSSGIGDVVITLEAMKTAKFPITIDPDSTFTTSASDGYLRYVDATYNTARTAGTAEIVSAGISVAHCGQSLYDGDYYIDRVFVYFDTESLNDAINITSGYVAIQYSVSWLDTDFDITIQSGMPTYPHDPLVVADFSYNYYSGDGGSNSTANHQSGYNRIYLNGTGLGWINVSGYTKFALRNDNEIAGTPPVDSELIDIDTYEKGVGYRPMLVITYTSASPTVTTNAASDVAATTARLNSVIDDDGGGDVTIRFGWGESSESAIVDYDHYETVAGTFNTGEHPYLDVGSLTGNTLYYFRVDATNDGGSDLGGELSFTTENAVGDPSDLTGIPTATTVSLTWTKGTGATNSLVRFGTGTYPTTPAGGFAVYNGTSSSAIHSELTGGTTYYYSVWGESGGGYSSGYDTVMVTTSAEVAAGEDLDVPISPSRWMSAPDYTNLSGLLFVYDGINNSADALNMPRETMWMVLALVLAVALGIGVYMVSGKNLFIGGIALAIGLIFGWMIQIIPFWIPLLSGIMIIAYAIGHREVKTY